MKEEKIIDGEIIKENDNIKGNKAGHKYGSWKPGRRRDNGKPLKKNGRKTGTIMVQEAQVNIEIGTVVNYLTFGKSVIENEENKKLKVKPNTSLSVQQACREFGIHPNTFYEHLRKFPALKEKYEMMKENKREYLRSNAEGNIEQALTGNFDLTDKELVDASFKMLEKTDKAYNPKTEIESKTIGITLNKSSDNLKEDLMEILGL